MEGISGLLLILILLTIHRTMEEEEEGIIQHHSLILEGIVMLYVSHLSLLRDDFESDPFTSLPRDCSDSSDSDSINRGSHYSTVPHLLVDHLVIEEEERDRVE